jgi:signal peptidase I
MEPTLFQSDRVLVSKVDYRLATPERGDIVVFDPTSDTAIPFVKRIVAIAGDVVELRDGRLYVNGEASEVPEAVGDTLPQSPQVVYPYTVPEGGFFAMGDNRQASSDSRSFGSQPTAQIIGKVILRFWPLDRLRFFEW